MPTQRENFLRNLLIITEERGITQKAISDALGIPMTTVNAWFHGKSYPRADALQRLADFIGAPVSALVGDGDPTIAADMAIIGRAMQHMTAGQRAALIRLAEEMGAKI